MIVSKIWRSNFPKLYKTGKPSAVSDPGSPHFHEGVDCTLRVTESHPNCHPVVELHPYPILLC